MPTRAWVPTDAVGVKVYEFDPSIAANIDVSNGVVTALRSSDGSLSAQPTTSAESPAYNATGVNGGPSIRFYNNGVANRLKTQAFTQGPNWAVFAVIKQSENTGTQSIIDADNYNTGTGNRVAQSLRFDGTNVQSIAFTPAVSTAAASVAQGTNLALKILGASLPSRTVQVSVDGGTLATATLNADPISASAVLTLGSWTANNQNFRGDMAIAYNVQGSLSQDDYDRFIGYLAWRFNKQGDLPANHPYKNAAPTITTGGASSYALAAAVGTMTITGRNAAISHIFSLACAFASFRLTGASPSLRIGRTVSPGSLTITPRPAGQGVSRAAAPGALTITGGSTSQGHLFTFACGPGSLQVTGRPAARGLGRSSLGGAFAVSPFPSTKGIGRQSAPAALALLGGAASRGLSRYAGAATFTMTGSPAGYTYNHAGSYVLGASTGQFTVSMFGDGNTKHRPFMKRKHTRFGLTP